MWYYREFLRIRTAYFTALWHSGIMQSASARICIWRVRVRDTRVLETCGSRKNPIPRTRLTRSRWPTQSQRAGQEMKVSIGNLRYVQKPNYKIIEASFGVKLKLESKRGILFALWQVMGFLCSHIFWWLELILKSMISKIRLPKIVKNCKCIEICVHGTLY